jgi:glycosyltransferase involved in cell wall biosynthesis
LLKHGVAVDVATTNDNVFEKLVVPLEQPVVEEGITYWYFPRQSVIYTFSWPLWRWLSVHICDYDVIHIHALFSFSSTAGAFWAVRRRIPYLVRPLGVLNTWGIRNRRPILKRLSLYAIERNILTNAAVVHFTSEQERCDAQLVAPGMRSVVVPNPIPSVGGKPRVSRETLLLKYPGLGGKKVVLFLSRLDPKKGIELLLDGFAKLRATRSDIALIVAGDGNQRCVSAWQRQAEQLKIQDDIVWAGFQEGEEKRQLLAGSDVFILPSYSENFGIAVVEAMASGLPVIISDQVGIQQDVSRAGAGVVIRCDAMEVHLALKRVLENEALRQNMSTNAQQLASSFSEETVAARLVEIYEKLIRGDLSFVEHSDQEGGGLA